MTDKKPIKLSEEEFYELVHEISKPVFRFMMRRITKEVLNNKEYQHLDVNDFFSAIIASMSSIDTNMIRWMQGFYKIKTNANLDQTKLVMSFMRGLQEQLKVVVQQEGIWLDVYFTVINAEEIVCKACRHNNR